MSWTTRLLSVVAVACALACGGEGGAEENEPPAERTTTRLHPDDLTYAGAFRLPEDFDWAARALAYDRREGGPEGGVLLVAGFEAAPATFARVSIPKPTVTNGWAALPLADRLTPIRSFDGDLIETQLSPDTTHGSGIAVVPAQGSQKTDKLYGAVDWWYAVSGKTFPTIWLSELDGSRPRGLFHVGPRSAPFHGNRMGDYLFEVPRWYADAFLGGRWLVTGKTRGAGGGSMGPTLFAFKPWDSEDPSGDLDALPVLWYRERYPECAGPDVGDKAACDYPDFTMGDKWLGAGFVESGTKRAVILHGVKGLGDNRYGKPREGDCSQHQGYHSDPYERQVIFYDVLELAEIAQGRRDAWTVVPYEIWRPKEFLLKEQTCGDTGGMAVDREGGRVFMVERGLGENNSAVVHVWTVAR